MSDKTKTQNGNETFELIDELGTGAFAHTYRVRVLERDKAKKWGKEVAIKIPRTKKYEHILIDELQTIFHIHAMLKGHDENIVRYLGHDEYDCKKVMVMEFVPGSLRDRLDEMGDRNVLSIDEALDIAQGILQGLIVVHEKADTVHRDIKPENILLDRSVAKITDLNVSRILQSNEWAKSRTGTLPYMSPESLGEQGVRFNTDLWSLGVTLYEMLTGQRPFGRPNSPPGTLIDLIRTSDHKPAKEINPDIPDEISRFIDEALIKDPAVRFQKARDMLQALIELRTPKVDPLEEKFAAINRIDDPIKEKRMLVRLEKEFPNDSRVYHHLGGFYNKTHHFSEAIETFERGIKLNPGSAMLNFDLGMTYSGRGSDEEALEALEEAISLGLRPGLNKRAQSVKRAIEKKIKRRKSAGA